MLKSAITGNSLVFQWLGLWASIAEGMLSISGQRTKIPHASRLKKKKNRKKEKILFKAKKKSIAVIINFQGTHLFFIEKFKNFLSFMLI